MKKRYVVLFALLVLVTAVTVSIRSVAQPADRRSGTDSSLASTNLLVRQVLAHRFDRLKWNTAATNLTDQQLDDLMNDAAKTNLAAQMWARMAMDSTRAYQSADISVAVRVLESLRGGHTNEAIRELEARLDGEVAWLGYGLDPGHPAMEPQTRTEYLKTLQKAKDYWLKYPRRAGSPNVDNGVKHALSLLDEK